MGITCCYKDQIRSESFQKYDAVLCSGEDLKVKRRSSGTKVESKNLSTIMSGYDQNKVLKQRATQKFPKTGNIVINSQIKEFHSFMRKNRDETSDQTVMERGKIFARGNERFIKEIEDTKVKSTVLVARPSTNLKVAPCFFRGERSGKIDDYYQTLDSIGKGGYGVVNKVRNIITNEIRAVKIIAKCKCQMSSSFSDEISILQRIVMWENKR